MKVSCIGALCFLAASWRSASAKAAPNGANGDFLWSRDAGVGGLREHFCEFLDFRTHAATAVAARASKQPKDKLDAELFAKADTAAKWRKGKKIISANHVPVVLTGDVAWVPYVGFRSGDVAVAFSADGSRFLTTSEGTNYDVEMWNTDTGER